MNDSVAIGALFTAWSTIMVAMYRRTNGNGPMGRQLTEMCERLKIVEEKLAHVKIRQKPGSPD